MGLNMYDNETLPKPQELKSGPLLCVTCYDHHKVWLRQYSQRCSNYNQQFFKKIKKMNGETFVENFHKRI